VFLHEAKRLAGAIQVQGDAKGPLTVKLAPWGTVTGRLVTEDGTPAPGVLLQVANRMLPDDSFQRFQTDQEGRFKVEGLAPDVPYTLEALRDGAVLDRVFTDLTVKSGETRVLGDFSMKSVKQKKVP